MSRIIIFTAIIIFSFSSCNKETLSKTYTIMSVNSEINGFVRGTENGSKTKIEIVLSGTEADTIYDVHFHQGPPNGYSGFAPYTFMGVKGLQDNTHHESEIDLSYNEFVKFDGTCVVHTASNQVVVARGGIGKNGL